MKESGRVAIVTGGARGIGRAAALALARDGANVVIADIDLEQAQKTAAEVEEIGRKSIASRVDVTDRKAVEDMTQEVITRYGHIDILVNNAGIIDDGLLVRLSDEAWHRVIDTNLTGAFYCTRAVLRTMLRQRWGRIISISSVVGLRGNAGQVNYSASKAAIIGFTKSLAKEVATRNITVNTVTPGYIETDTVAVLSQEVKDRIMALIPQGHFGTVEDIAHMVAFLADERSSYITGQIISVDGGMSI